ncbi:MAG: hypothetical protein P8Y70_00910 [Candidatus Lokiarchaeota archaeon]
MDQEDKEEKAWDTFQKIKGALEGLFEILNLSLEEDNILYQCGIDNLEKLKETILDVLTHDYDSKEMQYKLRELEFDIKKSLFFEKGQDK